MKQKLLRAPWKNPLKSIEFACSGAFAVTAFQIAQHFGKGERKFRTAESAAAGSDATGRQRLRQTPYRHPQQYVLTLDFKEEGGMGTFIVEIAYTIGMSEK
ncbi:hypothetical protein [Labrenzia sp. 011]|uniref:hypothetical protein n=1 Tax=Labrenzia sp. 011 TaxID=2171494 RepID=UPI00105746E6|nr:hypothetical protein [Labrenzia sp. 011]